jgi:outer membrane protein assembly factor BamB
MKSTNRLLTFLALCAALFAVAAPASAKRLAPQPVAPVVAEGIRYSAPLDAMGFVVATDAGANKELWRVRIYEVRMDPKLERDVQDIFITSLAVKDGTLLITNERGEKYALDLKTRKVTPQ